MLKKILTNLGLFVLLIILCFPTTYLFGWIYRIIYEPNSSDNFFNLVGGSFWGPSTIITAGFLMSVLFFIFLYLVFSLKRTYSIIFIVIINIFI